MRSAPVAPVVVGKLLDQPHHEDDRPDQEEDMMKLHGSSNGGGLGVTETV
jgi:hypothetical protein